MDRGAEEQWRRGWPAHLGSKGGEATVLGRWRGGLSTLPAEAARPLAPITPELAETTGSHRLPRRLHGLDMAHSSVDHSVHCLDTKPPVGVNWWPPKDTFTSSTSECDLIEKRIFVEVIKSFEMRSSWMTRMAPVTSVLMRDGGGEGAKGSQGASGATGSWKRQKGSSPGAVVGSGALRHLRSDSDSQMGDGIALCCLEPPRLWRPQETNTRSLQPAAQRPSKQITLVR